MMLGSVRTPGPCIWNWSIQFHCTGPEFRNSDLTGPLFTGVIMISKGRFTDERKIYAIALFPVGLGLKDRTCVGNTPDI